MILRALKSQWFLLALATVFAAVVLDGTQTLAGAGILLKTHHGASVLIFTVFLNSGLIIEVDQIASGIRDVRTTLATLFVILCAAPLAAVALGRDFLETGVVLGLYLVAVMPTTLSSGVVLTGQAGGNIAHALFVTIVSNCVAIISIPLILPAMLTRLSLNTPLAIAPWSIFVKLVLLVLLPLCISLAAKRFGLPIRPSLKKHLGMVNQFIILTIVFMSLSGARSVLMQQGHTLLTIVPLVALFHGLLLAAAFGISRLLKIGRGRCETVLIMGAQKTLPLAVMLQLTFFPAYGTALLVCVLHHIVHLIIDGYIAARMHP